MYSRFRSRQCSILKDGTTVDEQQAAATKLTWRNQPRDRISRHRLLTDKPLYQQRHNRIEFARVSTLTKTPPQGPPQEQPRVTTPPQAPPHALAPVTPKVAKSKARPIVHQRLIQGQRKENPQPKKATKRAKAKILPSRRSARCKKNAQQDQVETDFAPVFACCM